MPMPEASMHEHHGAILRQHDVGPARQLCTTQPIPQPPGMEALADKDLQLGVRTADPRHLRGSLLRGEAVYQGQALAFFFAGLVGSEAASWVRWGAMIRATSPITGTTTELPNCL